VAGDIANNGIIPSLTAGTYKLEIVTQYAGGNLLKEPRTAEFKKH